MPPLFQVEFWGRDLPCACNAAAIASRIIVRTSPPSGEVLTGEIVGVATSIVASIVSRRKSLVVGDLVRVTNYSF